MSVVFIETVLFVDMIQKFLEMEGLFVNERVIRHLLLLVIACFIAQIMIHQE